MAVNTNPGFIKKGLLKWSPLLTTANTTKDGSTLTVASHLLFVTPAEGALLERVRMKARGTNVATLLRLFVTSSTSGDPSTAANNAMLEEWPLPATTLSETVNTLTVDVPVGILLPANYRVFACLATTVAAGWQATAIAGDYDAGA